MSEASGSKEPSRVIPIELNPKPAEQNNIGAERAFVEQWLNVVSPDESAGNKARAVLTGVAAEVLTLPLLGLEVLDPGIRKKALSKIAELISQGRINDVLPYFSTLASLSPRAKESLGQKVIENSSLTDKENEGMPPGRRESLTSSEH